LATPSAENEASARPASPLPPSLPKIGTGVSVRGLAKSGFDTPPDQNAFQIRSIWPRISPVIMR
jgi:hypothetical protein